MKHKYEPADIIAWLNCELEGKEFADFQTALAENPLLQKEVKLYQELAKGISITGEEADRKSIAAAKEKLEKEGFFEIATLEPEWHEDLHKGLEIVEEENLRQTIGNVKDQLKEKGFFEKIENAPPKKVAKFRGLFGLRYVAAAAVTLVLIIAGSIIFSKPSSEQLFTQFYEPESEMLQSELKNLEIIGFADTQKGRKESLKAALKSYEKGEFENAGSALELHLQKYTDDQMAQFYMALSQIELKDFEKAADLLEASNVPEFQDVKQWYLALVYMKLGKKEAAIEALKVLSENANSKYQNWATRILKVLVS